METKLFSFSDKTQEKCLREAAEIIKNGGLVVFPTETVYGLGADATNPNATQKIYRAKGRPSDNPLIIHISNPADADRYAFTNSAYYLLAENFMPGPITIVLKSKETVPLTTRGGLDTVAIRCPENTVANRLISYSGVAIAAPSANISGSPSPTTFAHVLSDMNGRVDAIIDGGDCDFGLESTIIKIDDDGSLTLLRPGKITKEDIESLGLSVKVANAVTVSLSENETALSPGMKYKHYAPKSKFVLLDGSESRIIDFIKAESSKNLNIAFICYADDIAAVKDLNLKVDLFEFGKREDETTQAHLLFKLLRETDKKNYDVIYAPVPRKNGIGLALYNRMIRASAHNIIRL